MNRRSGIGKSQRGVSLVEILIVLMIAAMVAGVVIVSAPPLRSASQDESERFAARIAMAAEAAVTRGELIGLKVAKEGYRFYRYDRGEWQPYGGGIEGGAFPPEAAVSLKLEDAAAKNEQSETKKETEERPRPNVMFSPTGETTPFEIVFQERREINAVALDGAGKVEVKRNVEAR